jgi:hypothetical protein
VEMISFQDGGFYAQDLGHQLNWSGGLHAIVMPSCDYGLIGLISHLSMSTDPLLNMMYAAVDSLNGFPM